MFFPCSWLSHIGIWICLLLAKESILKKIMKNSTTTTSIFTTMQILNFIQEEIYLSVCEVLSKIPRNSKSSWNQSESSSLSSKWLSSLHLLWFRRETYSTSSSTIDAIIMSAPVWLPLGHQNLINLVFPAYLECCLQGNLTISSAQVRNNIETQSWWIFFHLHRSGLTHFGFWGQHCWSHFFTYGSPLQENKENWGSIHSHQLTGGIADSAFEAFETERTSNQ